MCDINPFQIYREMQYYLTQFLMNLAIPGLGTLPTFWAQLQEVSQCLSVCMYTSACSKFLFVLPFALRNGSFAISVFFPFLAWVCTSGNKFAE